MAKKISFVSLDRNFLQSKAWKDLSRFEQTTYLNIYSNYYGTNRTVTCTRKNRPFKISPRDFKTGSEGLEAKGVIKIQRTPKLSKRPYRFMLLRM